MSSQYGQEEWVIRLLNGKRKGFFIDSGAWDPIQLSNTYRLESEFMWNGVCVEPLPHCADALRACRGCSVVEVALDLANGTADFIVVGALSGLKGKTGKDVWDNNRSDPANKVITVRTATIGSVLEQVNAPRLIDYWSLDTEGNELDILRSFPWDKYSVSLISVEHNLENGRKEKIHEFMTELGYHVPSDIPDNVHESFYAKNTTVF